MIEQAQNSTSKEEYPNISYRMSSAESLPFLDYESVDLVVAGQAAHWFDTTLLWPEMKRVMRKGGTLAFWGYKDHVFVDYPRATKILDEYAYGESTLGPYWSQPGRSKVENKLRDIIPPASDWADVQRIEYEPRTEGPKTGEGTMFMSKTMTLGQCMDYGIYFSQLTDFSSVGHLFRAETS
jgi:ubiquinone/menaquinone biosynthesis C-methylase UbiE